MGADFVVKEEIFLNLNATPNSVPYPRQDIFSFRRNKALRTKCFIGCHRALAARRIRRRLRAAHCARASKDSRQAAFREAGVSIHTLWTKASQFSIASRISGR